MNNIKADFANTINEISSNSNLSANECEKYGMTWECDDDCPIFRDGKCKMEDIEAFKKQIFKTERFSSYTIEELNILYPKLKL